MVSEGGALYGRDIRRVLPYQYTGREADTAGLYYYRARYYSPMMAGFISEDPARFFGGQLSFYAYAGSDPIIYNDPSGRFLPEAAIGGLIGGAFGAMSGYLSGDRGSQLLEDSISGAATGALIGLTDGLSLAPNLAADAGLKAALDFGMSSGMETVRQLSNYGCVKSWGGVAIAGGLGALSAGSGTGVYQALGTELSDAASYANAAITALATGSLQNVVAGDEAAAEK